MQRLLEEQNLWKLNSCQLRNMQNMNVFYTMIIHTNERAPFVPSVSLVTASWKICPPYHYSFSCVSLISDCLPFLYNPPNNLNGWQHIELKENVEPESRKPEFSSTSATNQLDLCAFGLVTFLHSTSLFRSVKKLNEGSLSLGSFWEINSGSAILKI